MRQPRVKLTNSQAVRIYETYQTVTSRDLRQFIDIAPSTATKCIKYAQEWGEEQSLFIKKKDRERYLYVTTDVFLQAFGIDIKKRLRAVQCRV